MSEGTDNSEALKESVRLARERRERAREQGERPIAKNLAMIGALGWLIVVPTIVGVLGGRWIDKSQGDGPFWTLSLLFVGLVVGCWLAWKRMNRE